MKRSRRFLARGVVTLGLLLVPASISAQSIVTYAGGGSDDGRPAHGVSLNYPVGIAFDPDGNLHIADEFSHRIRRVDAETRIIATVAGIGAPDFAGDGGPATAASLNHPIGITFDSAGNLFIADRSNDRIRRVDAETGIISTVAGDGIRDFNGDQIPATEASLNYPQDVAVDEAGNLYIADYWNQRIRRVDLDTGIITTFAGSDERGFAGDGGPATEASLWHPIAVTFGPGGDLYIADALNQRIRRVDALDGIITTVAGDGDVEFSGDWGPATEASLAGPHSIAFDADGNLYVSDSGHDRVRRIDATTQMIHTVAGTGEAEYSGDGVAADEAALNYPHGVAIDPEGNLFIADEFNHRVRRVDSMTGIITTYAGNGRSGTSGDGGLAAHAAISRPVAIAPDEEGNLYIADFWNKRVRRVDAETGVIETIAGTGEAGSSGDGGPASQALLDGPMGIAVDRNGDIFIADYWENRVRRIDALTRTISTIAGNGEKGFNGDGIPASEASLNRPSGLAVGPDGDLYIADDHNSRIRRVEGGTGLITTVAGSGDRGFSGDGGLATEASLYFPEAIALDDAGNLYIADGLNDRIRRVDGETNIITTVVGIGSADFGGDGGPATEAALWWPSGVAIDPDGDLFIADQLHHRIRRVDRDTGMISTFVGDGTEGFGGDNGPATGAAMREPRRIAFDTEGNLYISDYQNDRVRVVYRCVDIVPPALATPANDAAGLDTSVALAWADAGKVARYDLYLDVVSPPRRLVSKDVEGSGFSITNLEARTTYYWQIVAKGDPFCVPFRTAASEVRSFTTTSTCEAPGEPILSGD